jgi:hypothetical protein
VAQTLRTSCPESQGRHTQSRTLAVAGLVARMGSPNAEGAMALDMHSSSHEKWTMSSLPGTHVNRNQNRLPPRIWLRWT